MNPLALILAAGLFFHVPIAAAEIVDSSGTLNVRIENISSKGGVIRIGLFSNALGFPEDSAQATRRTMVAVATTTLTVTFHELTRGPYAVSVHQDINENGKLDKSFWGAPKEPVGVSNNPPARTRPPTFEESEFEFDGTVADVVVHMSGS